MAVNGSGRNLRIGFIHPDLGIGGAERLVVDAAVALQNLGHDVVMFTSRHDPSRCFEETRDGTLKVQVLGSSLPRSLHPKLPMTIVFSILRNLLLTFLLWMSQVLPGPASRLNPLSPLHKFDVFFVDQQSVCVPFLRLLLDTPVVFYCHFPDKLLSGGWEIGAGSAAGPVELSRQVKSGTRASLVKRAYRRPIDRLEEFTTGQADVILANSKFSSRVYAAAFPSLARRPPRVVYPCIDVDSYRPSVGKGKAERERDSGVGLVTSDRPTLVSFNRFEAKKNVALAIEAFSRVKTSSNHLRLVVGGGYDAAQADNRETLAANQRLCKALGLSYHTAMTSNESPDPDVDVLFVINFTNAQRSALLHNRQTLALLYTPTNEHFGIVPIEAMACGLPVLACDTGGPTETVVDLESGSAGTGLLRPPTPEAWESALTTLINLSDTERKRISKAGKARVHDNFSSETLGRELDAACREAAKATNPHTTIGDTLIRFGATLMVVSLACLLVAVKVGDYFN